MITIEELKQKMGRFCAWRERSSHEVQDKLYQLGAGQGQVKQILSWLREENFINDQRFAMSFARGKFINNQWGKVRIIAELRQRKPDPETIDEAINQIDEDLYREMAEKLAIKKYDQLNDEDLFLRRQKTAAYLAGKGFEQDVVWRVVERFK
jgi:regulatory protein